MPVSEPYWQDATVAVHLGDCVEVLAQVDEASIDAICTDPPYGLEFMGREWDRPWAVTPRARVGYEGREENLTLPTHGDGRNANCGRCGGRARGARRCKCPQPQWDRSPAQDMRDYQEWCRAWAEECLRVLKPGGHLLAFGGTRTWHRLACAIEDAGFEIRDSIDWIYASGFPKSLDVAKAIDKAAGAERAVLTSGKPVKRMIPGADQNATGSWIKDNGREFVPTITEAATPEAARWEGWGTALKPSHEPIIVARKPLAGTVAANVLEHGTGALNIDGCRVTAADQKGSWAGYSKGTKDAYAQDAYSKTWIAAEDSKPGSRWPPNILLTHSPECEPAGIRTVRSDTHYPAERGQGGVSTSGHSGQAGLAERSPATEVVEVWDCAQGCPVAELDRQTGVLTSGSANVRRRSGADRDGNTSAAYGAESRPAGSAMVSYGDSGGASRFFPIFRYEAKATAAERPRGEDGHAHPTVKPLGLMRWLVRLVTQPGGLVLDPFGGSGTTAEACVAEGFRCVIVEKDPASAALIVKRLDRPIQVAMFGDEVP